MKIITLLTTLTLTALSSASLWAATVTHTFDTVTSVRILPGGGRPIYLSGIAKDTGAALTVTISSQLPGSGVDIKTEVQQCMPTFLMAMDKPGRYFLHITQDDASVGSFYGCILEVKI